MGAIKSGESHLSSQYFLFSVITQNEIGRANDKLANKPEIIGWYHGQAMQFNDVSLHCSANWIFEQVADNS